jgi:hypothetical protein
MNENDRPASRKQSRFIKKFSPPPSRASSPQLTQHIQQEQPITQVLYPAPKGGKKHKKSYKKHSKKSRKTKRIR